MPFWKRFRRKKDFSEGIKEESHDLERYDTRKSYLARSNSHKPNFSEKPISSSTKYKNLKPLGNLQKQASEASPLPKIPTLEIGETKARISSILEDKGEVDKVIHVSIAQIQMHLTLQEWEKGLALGQRVLKTYPNNPNMGEVRKLLGDICRQAGMFTNAIDYYKEALLFNPDDYVLHDSLGTLYGTLGDWQKAMSCYEDAVTLKPNFTEAYHHLSYAWHQLEKLEEKSGKHQEELIGAELFVPSSNLSTSKQIGVPWSNSSFLPDEWQESQVGEIFSNSQSLSDPLESYQQALKLDADFAHSHYNLGNTLYSQEDWLGAVEAYKKVIDLQPDFLDAYVCLGDAFGRLECWDESRLAYQQALRIDPSSSTVILKLAEIIKGSSESLATRKDPPIPEPEKKFINNVYDSSRAQGSDGNLGSTYITEPKQLQDLGNVRAILSDTVLFDESYYCSSHNLSQSDLSGLDNWLDHYIQVGVHRGYNPNPLFNTAYFQQQNPDVADLKINPLAHYYAFGRIEQRDPHPLFSHAFYLDEHPDVAATEICPLEHYLSYGAQEGRTAFACQQFAGLLHQTTPTDATYLDCWRSLMSEGSYREKQRKSERNSLQSFGIYCSSEGNYFITEIADHIAATLEQMGHHTFQLTEADQPNEQCDRLIIVAPHEFFYLGKGQQWVNHPEWWTDAIMVNVEQPQTTWFSKAFHFLRRSRLILDINVKSAAMLKELGLPAYWLPLGYLDNYQPFVGSEALPDLLGVKGLRRSVRQFRPSIDAPLSERPIDIHFVGSLNARRDRFFAQSGEWLNQYRCFFHIPPTQGPLIKGQGQALDTDAVIGVSRRSKILLNIHRNELPYFEWHRIVFHGLWQNTLVITEPCHDVPGLLPNVHFISCPLSEMQDHIEWLLRSPDGQLEAERIRRSGHLALKQVFQANQIMKNVIRLVND